LCTFFSGCRIISRAADDVKLISDPYVILETYKKILKSASSCIDVVYPTINAFFRHRNSGIFQILRELSKTSGVKVRVLLPIPHFNNEIRGEVDSQLNSYNMQFRALDKRAENTSTFVVADNRSAAVIELKDDTKYNFNKAISYAIFTDSTHIVSSFSSMFNTLWYQTEQNEHIVQQNLQLNLKNEELSRRQAELHESFQYLAEINKNLNEAKLKIEAHDKIQSEFINVAAHELRTPTQAIIGYCEMIEMLPERSKEYIGRLKRNADRLYTLTSDILDAAKIEAGTLTMNIGDFDLTETIMEVVKDIRKKTYAMHNDTDIRNMIPHIEFSANQPFFVQADRDRIIQVLLNLLDNAIKFSGHGTITIDLERNESTNEVIVRVTDSGEGIDPEIHTRLFEKFATKSDKGTGLGLYISNKIIQAHGGHMIGENNKNGAGATFSFSLPIHRS
jgi:two-component system, OmpR family, sensor histidine kinase VicK